MYSLVGCLRTSSSPPASWQAGQCEGWRRETQSVNRGSGPSASRPLSAMVGGQERGSVHIHLGVQCALVLVLSPRLPHPHINLIRGTRCKELFEH